MMGEGSERGRRRREGQDAIWEFKKKRAEEGTGNDSLPLSEISRLYYEDGLSIYALAKRFNLSWEKASNRIRDWDVHMRYYTEGHTFHRIACDLKLTITTLRRIFKKRGWFMRIQTERPLPNNSEIRRLHHDERLNFTQIAERCGIDLDIVRRAIGVRRAVSTDEEIGRLYFQEGFTFGQIAEHLGVSLKTIRRAFGKQKWTPRISATKKQLDPAWIHHLYFVEGFSIKEIASILNASYETIRKFFWEQRWILRNKQKNKKIGTIDSERREYQRKRRQELKDTRVRMFGSRCYACHSEKKPDKSLHIHRKDGKEHDRHLFRSLKRLKSLKTEEWAALCDRCHLGIHLLMKVFGFDWKSIEKFLEGRNKTSDTPKESLEFPDEDTPASKAFVSLGLDFDGTKKDLKKAIFGKDCSLCGCENEGKSLILHRKDGKPHDPSMTIRRKYLEKLNPSEWALVCPDCHNIAQWALEKLGIEWQDLVDNMKAK